MDLYIDPNSIRSQSAGLHFGKPLLTMVRGSEATGYDGQPG